MAASRAMMREVALTHRALLCFARVVLCDTERDSHHQLTSRPHHRRPCGRGARHCGPLEMVVAGGRVQQGGAGGGMAVYGDVGDDGEELEVRAAFPSPGGVRRAVVYINLLVATVLYSYE